jgi:signal transduction histidine kinase
MSAINRHASQKIPYDIDYRLKHKDGHYHWFHSNGQGLWDQEGKLIQMSGFITDIHQHKEIERLKDEFIANVSHELRTPLTSIRGSLSLISLGTAGRITPKTKELIDIAQKNAERLILLINDMLDLEKLTSGTMDFHFEEVLVNGLTKHAVNANLKLAKKHQIAITPRYLEQDAIIKVDKARFIQVLDNLLSNAIKFSYSGGLVEVILSRYRGFVRIMVVDRGIGIPKDFRPKIFQKFTQADASSSRQKAGTGLGLTITKQIVEYMNGKISFKSQVNKGTTFCVDIPEVRAA